MVVPQRRTVNILQVNTLEVRVFIVEFRPLIGKKRHVLEIVTDCERKIWLSSKVASKLRFFFFLEKTVLSAMSRGKYYTDDLLFFPWWVLSHFSENMELSKLSLNPSTTRGVPPCTTQSWTSFSKAPKPMRSIALQWILVANSKFGVASTSAGIFKSGEIGSKAARGLWAGIVTSAWISNMRKLVFENDQSASSSGNGKCY